MTPEQLREAAELNLQFEDDFELYARACLRVKDKDGKISPLVLNRAQKYLHEKLEAQKSARGRVRALILKGRQQGCSTYLQARGRWLLRRMAGLNMMTIAHEQDATDNLFAMAERYQENEPEVFRPKTKAANAKEIVFGSLDSTMQVATAGTKHTGRSKTIQVFHGCLAEGTPVVDGATGRLIPIERCTVGQPVRTHTGKLAVVSMVSTQSKECVELVMRGLRGIPLVCTSEHRFYTQRGWLEARDIAVGDRIGYPVTSLSGKLTKIDYAVPLGGGAGFVVPVDRKLGLLVGLYLAEGCLIRQSASGKATGVSFAMNEDEVERNRSWVEDLSEKYSSFSVRMRPGSKTVSIDVYGRALASRVEQWFGELDGKRLPSWWRECSAEFVDGLVCGYTGSGRLPAAGLKAESDSSAVIIGMRDAIASLGYGWADVSRTVDGSGAESWRLSLDNPAGSVSGGYAWVPVDEKKNAGLRRVFDFEVDDEDHSYCILHGATHNSEHAFWPHAADHSAGIGQTVPDKPGTEVWLETTSNGIGERGEPNDFYQRWLQAVAGHGDYVAIFLPWFWQAEYRRTVPADWQRTPEEQELAELYGLDDEQLAFRRNKIESDFRGDESRFRSEYPCIAEGTRVGTSDGLLPIERVREGSETAFGRVLRVLDKGAKETLRLRTALGYEVVCTPEHLIMTETGEWVEAKSCVSRRVALSKPALARRVAVSWWRPRPCVHASITVTEELGRWLGYFMGDGSVRNGVVSFACNARDADVISDIEDLSRRLFGVEPQRRTVGSKGGGIEVRFGSKEVADVLDRLGLVDHLGGSRTRRRVCVPEAIWRSPPEVVSQFLRGLFEADGYCGQIVTLYAKGREFIEDVQRLLLSFGITSRLRVAIKRAGNGVEYVGNTLSLRKHEAARFMELIGFVSERKRSAYVPPKRGGVIELLDEVVSIEPAGDRPVYDLEIEGAHRFDANGFVVHNCNWRESFTTSERDTFIKAASVMRARACQNAPASGPLVAACDPARYGDDRTAIVARQGRRTRAARRYENKSTMEVAGLIARFIDQYQPAAFFIDVIGIGAGVYDRLVELGYGGQDDESRNVVIPVNFAERATEDEKYVNKRAECWGCMKDWIEAFPCSLPDDDAWLLDLTAPGYTYDSHGRLRIESKESMRKAGLPSPDLGDALAMTFAEPVRERARKPALRRPEILDEVAGW